MYATLPNHANDSIYLNIHSHIDQQLTVSCAQPGACAITSIYSKKLYHLEKIAQRKVSTFQIDFNPQMVNNGYTININYQSGSLQYFYKGNQQNEGKTIVFGGDIGNNKNS